MGSSEVTEPGRLETPVHDVTIGKPFALGKYEVSNREFQAFVQAAGYEPQMGCRVHVGDHAVLNEMFHWRDDQHASWRLPGFRQPITDSMPATCVSRMDALAYVNWLSNKTGRLYRLPSESEWEYAARANSSESYPWGANPHVGCTEGNVYDRSSRADIDFGWVFADCEDGYAELAPVGRFNPNAFGLHDMIGNVYEWTADCYRSTYDQAPNDGQPVTSEACELWSVRGGSWITRPSRNRVSFRGRDAGDSRYNYFGFRVARDL